MVLLDVLEGKVHQTAVAAIVAVLFGAIHQILLTQGNQRTSLSRVLTLKGTSLD